MQKTQTLQKMQKIKKKTQKIKKKITQNQSQNPQS